MKSSKEVRNRMAVIVSTGTWKLEEQWNYVLSVLKKITANIEFYSQQKYAQE